MNRHHCVNVVSSIQDGIFILDTTDIICNGSWDGKLYIVGAGGSYTYVNFCPICGFRAAKGIQSREKKDD